MESFQDLMICWCAATSLTGLFFTRQAMTLKPLEEKGLDENIGLTESSHALNYGLSPSLPERVIILAVQKAALRSTLAKVWAQTELDKISLFEKEGAGRKKGSVKKTRNCGVQCRN